MYDHIGMEMKHYEKRISVAKVACDSEKFVTGYALVYAWSLFSELTRECFPVSFAQVGVMEAAPSTTE